MRVNEEQRKSRVQGRGGRRRSGYIYGQAVMEGAQQGGQANGGKGALPDRGAAIPGGCNSVFQTTT